MSTQLCTGSYYMIPKNSRTMLGCLSKAFMELHDLIEHGIQPGLTNFRDSIPTEETTRELDPKGPTWPQHQRRAQEVMP
ncbi:hypothetical protein ElyMa_004398500 [Elysia marginata]|uniref:Uncharacterized protein n=1 Tax=Elysia marginata TaxID=1093978 RepID=A0AAV4HCG1_9GAST|nr:hypothetical protein ElyMa_004398500 [Elysia marginata]